MATKVPSTKTKQWQPNPNITDTELAEMRKEVYDRIIIARVGLLLRHPFFGNMATRLRIVAADEWCGTAAVDGKFMYFNTQFFNALTNKEIEFVIAHEILHCVFDHLGRRTWQGRELHALLSNIAQDYIINNLLVRDRIGANPSIVQCYQDFKYSKWTSEEVYDDLFEKVKKQGQDILDKLGELLDEHLELDGDEGEEGNDGKPGAGRPKYSKDELEQIRNDVKDGMMQAAQSAGAGNTPAEVQRLIKDLTEPKMNWRELIRQEIKSIISHDYTFINPNRKSQMTGAILPGMNVLDTIDVVMSMDMSGSIGDVQAKDMISEVKGVMEEFTGYKIKLWCFDTKVYNEQDFSSDGAEDLLDYEVMGGGGTDFMANWTYMKQHDIQPKKFIMFTDGYPWDSWGDPDYCDTLFIIHDHADKNLEAPFGLTAHYDAA
jgi:predicted metal-dependent peptidase